MWARLGLEVRLGGVATLTISGSCGAVWDRLGLGSILRDVQNVGRVIPDKIYQEKPKLELSSKHYTYLLAKYEFPTPILSGSIRKWRSLDFSS